MADYCWVYGVIHFTSPAGWLPVHRELTPGPTLGNEYGKTLPFFNHGGVWTGGHSPLRTRCRGVYDWATRARAALQQQQQQQRRRRRQLINSHRARVDAKPCSLQHRARLLPRWRSLTMAPAAAAWACIRDSICLRPSPRSLSERR